MAKKKVNLIEQFIINNKLDFTGSGSDLNGNCVILAGYACYLELSYLELQDYMRHTITLSSSSWLELKRVFDYAYCNNYDEYWKTAGAKSTYIY